MRNENDKYDKQLMPSFAHADDTRITLGLQAAFAELGAVMEMDHCGLFLLKYDNMEYFIDVDEKEGGFCVSQIVMGINGKLSQSEFDTVMDVVKSYHPEYEGEWNEGLAYVLSPWYIVSRTRFNGKAFKIILENFFEAWSFACTNAAIVTDETIWK